MQIKSIRKNIENKMNLWLNSITDDKLRTKVENNLLVSGGCITSLLLKEEVNDYDIYIKMQDVLYDLVVYYTQPYKNIKVLDGRKKDLYLSELSDNEMGGVQYISIKNLKSEQVKLTFKNKDAGLQINKDVVCKDDSEFIPTFFSPNAISISNNIQIVTRFHGTNETIHKNFDFIHATNYFTFRDGLVTNREALESILTKQLRYQGSLYPLTSIIRMKKFIKRNWNINAGEILKIMFQISELDLKDFDVLEDQLMGVDVAYFSKLIAIIKAMDKSSKLTSSYLNKIIDRVFNEDELDGENN